MSLRMVARVMTAVAVAAVSTVIALPASAGPRPPGPDLVRVEGGWLRGDASEKSVTFSGIPYAAAPTGDRRWRPPARPKGWSGVRAATSPSPYCPQGGPEEGVVVGQEDCLYLDVTVPRSVKNGKRLPVLVWLHGGGLNSGGAREFDGARLAVGGDMIVVTVNYRLGALGFLSSPELDGTGNYGLMDQTAALRWVSRNSARFGGDPRSVTLAGQSGGARSVCAHLASPASRGLFSRAISQSGACDNRVLTLAAANAFGAQAVDDLGCAQSADVAGCLRKRKVSDLVAVLGELGGGLTGRVQNRPWNPVAGTKQLPRQPADALRQGTGARVPLLIGGNRDEMRQFVSHAAGLTAAQYIAMITTTFGDRASAVLAEYPVTRYASPALALATVLGDWGGSIGACPMLRTAAAASPHQPVYAYEFAEDSGQVTETGFPTGAYHGLELPYLADLDLLWGNPYPPLNAGQRKLSSTMIAYWASFARTGDPNGPSRPRWADFRSHGAVTGLTAITIQPVSFPVNHHCDFWAKLPASSTKADPS